MPLPTRTSAVVAWSRSGVFLPDVGWFILWVVWPTSSRVYTFKLILQLFPILAVFFCDMHVAFFLWSLLDCGLEYKSTNGFKVGFACYHFRWISWFLFDDLVQIEILQRLPLVTSEPSHWCGSSLFVCQRLWSRVGSKWYQMGTVSFFWTLFYSKFILRKMWGADFLLVLIFLVAGTTPKS